MEEIELDKIIKMVSKEVVRELQEQGVKVVDSSNNSGVDISNFSKSKTKTEKIDMSKYKSPVLTENHIKDLHELTGRIILPKDTIMTPKAKEKIKENNLEVDYE